MKKLNFVVGDPQTCLGVQETFLYIRESPATRGRTYKSIQSKRPSLFVKSRYSGHVGCMCFMPVVVLRTNVFKILIMLTLLYKTSPPLQQHTQINKNNKNHKTIEIAKYGPITEKIYDPHTYTTLKQHNTKYLKLTTSLNTLTPSSLLPAPHRTFRSPIPATQIPKPFTSPYQAPHLKHDSYRNSLQKSITTITK